MTEKEHVQNRNITSTNMHKHTTIQVKNSKKLKYQTATKSHSQDIAEGRSRTKFFITMKINIEACM